jgi:RimJ/RimL family protein N-acetyltransferase
MPAEARGQRMPATVAPPILAFTTVRLRLRQWQASDRAPFAEMNADPRVMRYFAAPQTAEASGRTIDVWSAEIAERGWSNWAVETLQAGIFIGFVGLSVPRRALPFMPCVEIGWRLRAEHWGRGFATEAAQAVLAAGFETIGLDEIVSFTSLVNQPSRAVMARIGMVTDPAEDFDHPALPEGSELRRHCLYRLPRSTWERNHP